MTEQDPATDPVEGLVARCEELMIEGGMAAVADWKEAGEGRRALGYLPIYVPREVIHAAGFLPVGVVGGGDGIEIIRGDAYFQSYICHFPRSVIEMGLSGRMDCLDGAVFPATCDVIRNLSGMWQVLFPGKYAKYLDVPQNLAPELGGRFYELELRTLAADLGRLSGVEVTAEALFASIAVYEENRQAVEAMFAARVEFPERVPTWELYALMRAGLVLPPEEHTALVRRYTAGALSREARVRDNPRVVVVGAFCEQPPMGLIRTLERAGCYIVDDDFQLGQRWLKAAVPMEGDPFRALALTYLRHSTQAATRFHPDGEEKGQELLGIVKRTGAEGVVFCSPSFCDPSLLDRPMLTDALDAAGVPWTGFKYAENTGQFQGIREQAGTFSDSIRLWSHA